jgi:hypothetical protein
MKVTLYIYAETSVLFVRIFNSLLRDGNGCIYESATG